jgi:hypothetical protein
VRSRCCYFGRPVSLQLALPSTHDAVRMWLLRRRGAVQSAPLGAAVPREATPCRGHRLVSLARAWRSNGSRPRSLAGLASATDALLGFALPLVLQYPTVKSGELADKHAHVCDGDGEEGHELHVQTALIGVRVRYDEDAVVPCSSARVMQSG